MLYVISQYFCLFGYVKMTAMSTASLYDVFAESHHRKLSCVSLCLGAHIESTIDLEQGDVTVLWDIIFAAIVRMMLRRSAASPQGLRGPGIIGAHDRRV